MKNLIKNYIFILAAATVAAFTMSSCSMLGSKPAADNSTGTPTNAEIKSVNANNTANANSTASSNSAMTSPAPAPDIAGNYAVTGSNPDGGKPYEGTLVVTKRDSVYQFSWNAGSEYDGVGVQKGNTIAVAYASGKSGKGCGAVIYETGAGGALDGKFGEWGVNEAGTEKGTMVEGGGFVGVFDVSGTNLDGKPYKGKLSIKKEGEEIHQLDWNVGAKYFGTGVKQSNYLAAGYGSKDCGFVIYEVSGGSLNGKWGFPGAKTLGTEKGVKK